MQVYDRITDMLERELEQIAGKNELTSNNLEVMDKAVDVIKDIETICAMREASENGYSNGYMPMYMYEDGGMSNASYARGRGKYAKRDSMGRYSSEYSGNDYPENDYSNRYSREQRGYSREESRNRMASELDRMEREATTEEQRNMIRNWKNQIK